MRSFWCGALVLCLAFMSSGRIRADDNADAKPILDKAIKALGEEAKVATLASASFKVKGSAQVGGTDISATIDGLWHGVDRYRMEAEAQAGGNTSKSLMVINGDKGWAKNGDKTEDAPKEVTPLILSVMYAIRSPMLLPALRGKAFKLSPLGEVKVGEQQTVALSVTHKDLKDLSLYFDKESGLVVKSEIRVTDPSGKEITVECQYSDYKENAGVKHPTRAKVKADMQEFTLELSEIKPLDKIDDSNFAKP